jgi:tRNA nucleotidyltransferase (CCA-adding enzyme)
MDTINKLLSYKPLEKILRVLNQNCKAYLVGGMVRDSISGKPVNDIDLACILEPQAISALLEGQGFRVVPTGIEHGTILVVVDEEPIEITTFRSASARYETKYSQTIEEDLAGRDFTINAMAIDTETQALIDPFGGKHDLDAQIVRCVGNAEARLSEDPLRILRAIRFGPAAGWAIEPLTGEAIRICGSLLESVSVERIREEISKILLSPEPAAGIRAINHYGLLRYTVPELEPAVGCEQNKWHVHDVFEHTLAVIERTPPDLLLRLTALFHDIGKPHTVSVDPDGERHFYHHEHVGTDICKSAMHRLKYSNDLIESTTTLVRFHMRPLKCSDAAVRRLMRDLGPLLDPWRRFKWADKSPTMPQDEFDLESADFDSKLDLELNRQDYQARTKLAIDGNDIMSEFGLKPGPKLGNILNQLKELILDSPELNTREGLLEIIKGLLQ